MVDYTQLILVLLGVAAALGGAFIVLVRRILRWRQRSRATSLDWEMRGVAEQLRPLTRAQSICERAVLGIGATALAGVVWGLIEPRWVETTRHEVGLTTLASHARIRVVQLSDLHSQAEPFAEARIVEKVAKLKPDLIVFTGDAVNEDAGLATFRSTMTDLARIAPTFSVRGNWETWWFSHLELYRGTGVQPLDGRAKAVTIRGHELWLIGVGVDHEDQLTHALARVPKGSPTILLHHFPALAPRAQKLGIDLMLAGDTHGGQARLPLLGELVRIKRHGIWRSAGMHREGAMWLYVHRGLGAEGGIPRFRFACRPEIAVLDLVASAR